MIYKNNFKIKILSSLNENVLVCFLIFQKLYQLLIHEKKECDCSIENGDKKLGQ